MILFSQGSPETCMSREEIREALFGCFRKLGEKKRVLAVPPDFTRYHSCSGMLTEMAWAYYGDRMTDILPATGTHRPMTDEEIEIMFGKVPKRLFRVHDCRQGLATLGEVPASFVREVSEGKTDYSIPVQVDRLIAGGKFDLILSIGQVVPHEVVGMSGYNKNIFIGTGGIDPVNRTHFLGSVYGMERIMGRSDTAVRRVFNYSSEKFADQLPILYILSVVGKNDHGELCIRGIFVGDELECFRRAAALSLAVNIRILDLPLKKIVVYLDPMEFRSAWLGNKSIYRTRMALADGGELIILAPGLERFGEDDEIDRLIRKYGYMGTPRVLELVGSQEDLRQNLGTAAHLIHGSSEGRFRITYCPGRLTQREIEGVGFRYGDLRAMTARYNSGTLVDGFNTLADGEEVFYISNPALGLWARREYFDSPSIGF
jgi:nickel-dependent lactate racemase